MAGVVKERSLTRHRPRVPAWGMMDGPVGQVDLRPAWQARLYPPCELEAL